MATIQELYREFLNHSRSERIDIARSAGAEVVKFLQSSGLSEDDQFSFFLSALGLFISADGRVSNAEADLFNQLLGTNSSASELQQGLANCGKPEFINAMDEIIDAMPEEDKANLCVLGLAFLASDGELTQREVAVFEKILG